MYTDRYDTDFFYVGNHRSLLNTSGDMAAMDAWYRRGLPQYMDDKLDEDIVVRKLYDFRSAREGEVGAGTTKFGVGPMRSWVDDVREPTQTPFIDTKEARLNAKYSSPRSAEESARRRLAYLFVDDGKDKRKKPILSYSQPITDSRNRILGAREEGEAGAFSSFDDLDKGVYLVRRKNSDEIKQAGVDKKSVKLTDIIPFGQYNIGGTDDVIDQRPRSALGDTHSGAYFTDENYPKGFFDKATSVAEMIKK